MRQLTLQRIDREPEDPNFPAYGMDLTITAAQDIPFEVFVKQRISEIDDEFAAVATPAQLEELSDEGPGPDTSFYRSASVELYATNPDALNWIYDEVKAELALLIANLNALDEPAVPSTSVVIT